MTYVVVENIAGHAVVVSETDVAVAGCESTNVAENDHRHALE